jgi:hypothetical protein
MTDAVTAKAATLVSRPVKGDAPSQADVLMDFDFLGGDGLDCRPFLRKHGITFDPGVKYYWIPVNERAAMQYITQGWQHVEPRVFNGDLVLAFMPMALAKRRAAAHAEMNRQREGAPMRRFEQEAGPITEDGRISTFDGDQSPRQGM